MTLNKDYLKRASTYTTLLGVAIGAFLTYAPQAGLDGNVILGLSALNAICQVISFKGKQL